MTSTDTQIDRGLAYAKANPDRRWLIQPMGNGEVRELTWGQAMDEARRMAAHLASLDLPPKSQIALLSKNSAWWILADLAIWMAGHVSVPLYPVLPAQEIAYILDHSEAKMIFVGKLDGFEEMAPGIPADMPRIVLPLAPDGATGEQWSDIIARTEPIAEVAKRDLAEMATIVYTSGSTGVPKGVMQTFGAMTLAAAGIGRELSLTADERMLSYLPLAHVMERWIVETCTLYHNYEVFFAESLDTFVKDLKRARPTLFVSVPRLWQKFQQGVTAKMPPSRLNLLLKIPIIKGIIAKKVLTQLGLDAVRFAGSGSAPIPKELIEWYRSLGLELLEAYGMTENFCYSHVNKPGQVRPGFVGSPYADVQCRISEEGEIQVKSPGDMSGYYKMPEASAESFTEDGFLKTGDRGEIDEQGRLRITGRVKELFKTSKGKYVAPAPIENKVQLHPDVEAACVSGSGLESAYAMIVLSETAIARVAAGEKDHISTSLAAHMEVVNAELAHHERLGALIVVSDPWTIESGLLTPTMKLKRNKIEERYGPKAADWLATREPVVWA